MIEHAFHLILLLLAARLFGEIAMRLGQPALVGEIIAGIVLVILVNYSPVPLHAEITQSPFLDLAAELGIFFLLVLAGLEISTGELFRNSGRTIAVALGGSALPLALGIAFAWFVLPDTPMKFAQTLLIGVALSISAVPVAVSVFMDMGTLHTPIGRTVIAAAVLDDLVGFVLLALLTGAIAVGAALGIATLLPVLAKTALFFLIVAAVAYGIRSRTAAFISRLRIPAPEFSALVLVAMAFSALAELLSIDFIIGAFAAGLLFDTKTLGEAGFARLKANVRDFTMGMLAPLFFLSIGVRVDFAALSVIPGTVAALIAIGLIGKILGAGIPALLTGMTRKEAQGVGYGLSARGEVGLIVVTIALEAGLFNSPDPVVANLFSALVLMALVTTVFTPIALRLLVRGDEASAV